MKVWTERDIDRAFKLKAGGMSYAEVGAAMGKTQRSVQCALERHRGQKVCRDIYNGDPIGRCDDSIRYQENAVEGSAKLLAEIERVFGQQRMAA